SKTIVAEMPGIFAYVVAQGDGPFIGCRITVDGRLVDQQESHNRDAQVSCLDKSA
ncbi:MmpS family transport accessory protein, partial [Mycobacterium avium]